ncbi:MAG TPA: extracellular solute-binding protein [Candidatus Avipropionibacterium avicola]|uniref:Extracellular solute-binding protein n=1 Tax=Candidatus Avipropionibacterium avicola TaxID=2840701 RepID=A0A9D1GY32_9ACTN|nr:extracellular solute-binding protein [Candidatus Avipropionibacterium avicola]
MQPITRRTVLTSAAAIASTAALASCSRDNGGQAQDKIDNPDENINFEGMPIVNETITISMMSKRPSGTAEDWNTVASIKKMEQMSNIHVEWGLIPAEGISERRNLALASGDYPEVLYRTGLGAVDLAKHGAAGVLIPLNDLIAQYMPNLTARLDASPDIRKGMTFPDGNIYSLPTIYDPDFDSLLMQNQMWVRQDWLDQVGMEVPTTLEEFEAYLDEVKAANPAPSGETAIPLTDAGNASGIYEMLWGTFGIQNRGRSVGSIDADPSGDGLRFIPVSDGYREALELLNRLYSKGLIQADIFNNDSDTFVNLGKQGLIGACATQTTRGYFGKEYGDRYVPLAPLKKTSADPVPAWHSVGSPLAAFGNFAVTDKAEHPIEACRWMDYFYGDEGARLFFLGIEDESYEKTDDGWDFTDVITDNPDGLTVDEALIPYVIYMGGGYAGVVLEDYFKGMENSAQAREGTAAVSEHRIDEVWPAFTFEPAEADEMSSLTTDITKLVDESRAKFINGELPLSQWDTYVGQFEQAGLPRYLEIQQAAYERYVG